MIQEAGDDYDHTWSSIRHPATNEPRVNASSNRRHQKFDQLTTVPEEMAQLTINPPATPMAQLLAEQMRNPPAN